MCMLHCKEIKSSSKSSITISLFNHQAPAVSNFIVEIVILNRRQILKLVMVNHRQTDEI